LAILAGVFRNGASPTFACDSLNVMKTLLNFLFRRRKTSIPWLGFYLANYNDEQFQRPGIRYFTPSRW
jgi:hypothetical protein